MNRLLLLVFAAGALLGALPAFVLGRRRGARQTQLRFAADTAALPPLPDAGFPADANYEATAESLVLRCAARVDMPCALVMRDREGAPAHVVAVSEGVDRRLVGETVDLLSAGGRPILEGVPVVAAPGEQMVPSGQRDRRRPVVGGVAVPVGQGGRPVGAIIAFGQAPRGVHDTIHGLLALANIFAGSLLPAHAVAVAQRRAETDALTGLPNRRAIGSAIARPGETAALIVLDIDHFKLVNDTYGHPAGDAALTHVARLLQETIRGVDTAARTGGEEFAVWLSGASEQSALEVAERLRARVEREPFRWEGQELRLTISCGVAAYPSPIGHLDNLMQCADAALYQAKHAGRNRVVAAKHEARAVPPA